MIKRMIAMLMTLVLMLCVFPAGAESDVYAAVNEAVYRIVLRTEGEDITLGSGVLFAQQDVLLTAEACCKEGDLFAIGEDGEHAILLWNLVEDTGAALMQLATPSAAQPLTLAGYDVQSLPCIFGADVMGNVGTVPLYYVLHAMYREKKALQLSGAEGLLPGAVVADERGQIVALVVSQQMEGVGMYTALEPDVLYTAISGDTEAYLPLEIRWSNGYLNITWKDSLRESGLYLITLSSEENQYYTSYEAEKNEKNFQLALPAGHTYYMQVQWAESADKAADLTWSAMDAYTVPEMAFTQYGFQQECYLSSAPAGQEITELMTEMPFISVDTLTAENTALYLQVINRYDVSEVLDAPMTVSLTAPDGQFYFEEMVYTFSPEYEQNDSFAVPVNRLFDGCRDFSGRGTLPAGDYVIQYTIAGKIAGEYAFTVQPAGTPIPDAAEAPLPTEEPAPAESGFVTGLAVTHENGRITVDWAGCSIPEGKRVTAYILYDGNTYYTFNEPVEGVTSVSFPSIPGVGCMVWAAYASEGNPNLVPTTRTQCVIVDAQGKQPFTLHGFTNLRSGVTVTDDPDAAEKAAYLPEIPLTREAITSGSRICFQTEDTYSVTEESSDHILTIVLHTPEGMRFMTAGGYTFAPELNGSDLWLLDITELFESYASLVHTEPWPAGEYIVGYYIDGQVVSESVFILE